MTPLSIRNWPPSSIGRPGTVANKSCLRGDGRLPKSAATDRCLKGTWRQSADDCARWWNSWRGTGRGGRPGRIQSARGSGGVSRAESARGSSHSRPGSRQVPRLARPDDRRRSGPKSIPRPQQHADGPETIGGIDWARAIDARGAQGACEEGREMTERFRAFAPLRFCVSFRSASRVHDSSACAKQSEFCEAQND